MQNFASLPRQHDGIEYGIVYAYNFNTANMPVSETSLMRVFKVNFKAASNVMNELERLGIVGPYEAGKSRKVYITKEEYLQRAQKLNLIKFINDFTDIVKSRTYEIQSINQPKSNTKYEAEKMNKKELDDILAMPLEERQALQQKIINEMGDDWERELDARNMARAEIAAEKHQNELNRIDIDKLKHIQSNDNIVLSPAEILLMQYVGGKSINDIPGYFTYKYKIDYKISFEKMFSAGYLTFASVEYSLNKCTIPQLKELLKENKLKTTGKKAELVTRVIENIPPDNLKKFENQYFKVTDKGTALINNSSHIQLFHSIYNKVNISIDEADKYKREHPTLSDIEIGLDILDKTLKHKLSIKNYGHARNICYGKAEVCSYSKQKEQALGYYCLVCYLDKTLSEEMQLRHPDFPTYASGIISSMKIILQSLDIDKEDFREIYNRNIHCFFEENNEYDLTYLKKDENEVFNELSKILNL